MMAKYILENECCEVCGNSLELNTEAEQQSNLDFYDFYAFDGDEAKCVECKELHVVTVIENEGAYITIA